MSMECFKRADALHAHEKMIRSIKIKDADSLCKYLKGFFEFIHNHKMFGCVYDIYDDGIEVIRENGYSLHGIPAVEQDVMNLHTAFPNLQVNIPEIFAKKVGDGSYKVWMRYYFVGKNTGPSIYGHPTGLEMSGTQCICLSTYYVEKVDDEYLIVKERTGRSDDYIRAVCTGDDSFANFNLPKAKE